jgi:hypothetical protein
LEQPAEPQEALPEVQPAEPQEVQPVEPQEAQPAEVQPVEPREAQPVEVQPVEPQEVQPAEPRQGRRFPGQHREQRSFLEQRVTRAWSLIPAPELRWTPLATTTASSCWSIPTVCRSIPPLPPELPEHPPQERRKSPQQLEFSTVEPQRTPKSCGYSFKEPPCAVSVSPRRR